jgi:hypothetical protein
MAREVVTLMLDVPEESVAVVVVPHLPPDVVAVIGRYHQTRETATRATLEAADASRDAAKHLEKMGLTVRDIGKVMGLSFQRVQQLLH